MARELEEKLEVRCDRYLFRRNFILAISQRENRRKELEYEGKGKEAELLKEEKEVRKLEEKPKVCCDPYPFQQNVILTPS